MRTVEMTPCWAIMTAFAEPLELGFDGAFIHDSPLTWVARNGSKPGRPSTETWVLHASPEWSREHLETSGDGAASRLLAAFREAVGRDLAPPVHIVGHRWRFALPVNPLAEPCLVDAARSVAVCGDWAGGPRVEGAFLSGCAAAEHLLEVLNRSFDVQAVSESNR
jgi:predicted NAD/FAD-dependent oxidoreductase